MEIDNLSNKEFKVMVINVLTKLGRRMGEHSENLNLKKKEYKKLKIDGYIHGLPYTNLMVTTNQKPKNRYTKGSKRGIQV